MQATPKRRARARAKPAIPSLPTARRPVGPRPTTFGLVERIAQLQLRQVTLETFASEMVPLLLDALDAPAGALLLYHCRTETLDIIGARGLSAAGQRHLENLRHADLRRDAADSWEIPLHGLLNRKAYIIACPDEHPFVPELVSRDVMPHAVNLASIPLYRGALPVGVLLAVADRHPIGERELLTHVLAFDSLAIALDDFMRARAPHAGTASGAPSAAPVEGPVACEPPVDPRELVARLEAELCSEQAARDALASRLADAEARLAAATAALERAAEERADRS
jgi:hypothetical protein